MSTNKTYLPVEDAIKWKEFQAWYLSTTDDEIERIARNLGYANRRGLVGAMRGKGIRRVNKAPDTGLQQEPLVVNLPPVKLKSYKPIKIKGKGDAETQVLVLSDHHIAEITPSYNLDVHQSRLNQLYQSTLSITELHRNMYPVNDLVIFINGDMVHGENPYQGAKVGSIQMGAQEQIYDYALPRLNDFILSCKQEFKNVSVYAVRGNHGKYSREAPATSNWDIMLYKAMRGLLNRYDIDVVIADSFAQIVNIKGFKFFQFHGDQVRASQGIPYFALTRKVLSWYITYGGFNYAVCAHWHKDDFFRISAKTKLFINGSTVSDDPFALEVIGTSSIPCQWTFGVHERKGISWCYSLIADHKFLPESYKEVLPLKS